MKKGLQLAITLVLRQKIEIVLTKLGVEEDMVRELAKKLNTGPPQADVKCLTGRFAHNGRSRVAVIVTQPYLIEERPF